MSHSVTITHDPASHKLGCHDECTEQVTCTGVTDACRCWWRCDTCHTIREGLSDEEITAFDERLEDEEHAHGKEHQRIDGDWMTPSNQCLVHVMENDAYELVFRLPDGVHPVDIDSDEGFVYVTAIEPTTPKETP